MSKHAYTLIGLGILAGPLALSFDQRVFFVQHWPWVGLATLLVGSVYVAWDAWAVRRGHWTFEPRWTGSWRLWELPAGEWLFFVAVPYATVFLLEVFGSYFGRDAVAPVPRWVSFALAASFLSLAWAWREKGYTFLALLACAVFLTLQGLVVVDFWKRRDVLLTMLTSFGAFLLINGLYTRLPTIHYSPQSIWGPKVFTIPLEDFLYNLSLVGLYLTVYLWLKEGAQPWV